MGQAKKKKRFRYFVDKPFQTKFILNFVVLVLISAVVSLGFILYVDSQKFARGVLFEELVKDFYKTTDLSIESVRVRNIVNGITTIEPNLKNRILSDIEAYIRGLNKVEGSIKEAIELRKKLIGKISLGSEESIFYVINEAIKKGNLRTGGLDSERIKSEVGIWRINIERGIQECEFEVATETLDKVLSILSDEKDINTVMGFRKDFDTFKITVMDAYNFLTNVPKFTEEVDLLVANLRASGIDESVVSSLSASISKIKLIVASVRSYNSVLSYETRTYGKKAYNLLDLYWKPILALSVLQIILIVVFGLFFSHKIAGPVHRIKKELRDIAEGRLPVTHEIKLRKKDFLLDIAKEVNNTLKSIANRYNIS
ncbi:MAG: hypothetical protein ABDH28_05870 [Brevinematia bacterium]